MTTHRRPDDLVEGLSGKTVLIIGDVMLDHFVIGRVERISPEAPVPVVQFEQEEYRLGGAANVASNVVSLGGRVEVIGVVGHDADAGRLCQQLMIASIGISGVVSDPARCTTRKLRVVTTRNQQVARIDYERDHEIGGEVEETVLRKLDELSGAADAILVSDYLKGTVSRAVAAAAVRASQRRNVPLL
ncbi:MAG TPA: PfkB family carbohydrate kinase, partial [Vicinamibacterales bacterium]|nr:PfkB family carbohydrate kinase [Vicinamibacterales bacterium]